LTQPASWTKMRFYVSGYARTLAWVRSFLRQWLFYSAHDNALSSKPRRCCIY
jgi:hypothetical protein